MPLRRRQSFSRDMDAYLRSRGTNRGQFNFSQVFKRKPKEDAIPLVNEDRSITVEDISPEPGFFSKLLSIFKREKQQEDLFVEEVAVVKETETNQSDVYYEDLDAPPKQEQKEGFFTRLFASFRTEKQEDVVVLDARDDMKLLGQSLFRVLDNLPTEEKSKLKRNPEWENVKEVLRKYEVIR